MYFREMLFYNLNISIQSLDGKDTFDLIIPSLSSTLTQNLVKVLVNPTTETEDEAISFCEYLNEALGLNNVRWQPPASFMPGAEKKRIDIADLGDIPLQYFGDVMNKLDTNDFNLSGDEAENNLNISNDNLFLTEDHIRSHKILTLN